MLTADVNAANPLCEYQAYPDGTPASVAPDSVTTDDQGYIYWYNKGNSTGSWWMRLGLDLGGTAGVFDGTDPYKQAHMAWDAA